MTTVSHPGSTRLPLAAGVAAPVHVNAPPFSPAPNVVLRLHDLSACWTVL